MEGRLEYHVSNARKHDAIILTGKYERKSAVENKNNVKNASRKWQRKKTALKPARLNIKIC
jgi:hypothetical protein